MKFFHSIHFQLYLLLLKTTFGSNPKPFDESVCKSVENFYEIRKHIQSFSKDVMKIIDFVVNGEDKGVSYKELSKFIDKFGYRFAGTQNLENAIDYMQNILRQEKHFVKSEPVLIPTWIRGHEWAEMISPRRKPMPMLGSGFSVGTNGKVLTAEVVAITSFEELEQRSEEIYGKIVLFNAKMNSNSFHDYGNVSKYRLSGASEAAKYGAIAAMIRSITTYSLNTPHTGAQDYYKNVTKKIPALCITIEDSDLITRMIERDEEVVVSIYMEAKNGPEVISRNTISEIRGHEMPNQNVIIFGHIDSWDVGDGASDNGGGAFISWRALSVIKKLGLKPKRTLKCLLPTAEELGYYGAKAYIKRHKRRLKEISIALETDSGQSKPIGLSFAGTQPKAQCIVNEVVKLLAPINASELILDKDGADLTEFLDSGVPGGGLLNLNEHYFDYHHSNGDTMNVINTIDLDLCTAFWTSVSYVFASIDYMIPR